MAKKKVLSWGFGCLLLETEESSKKVAKVWCRTCPEFYGQAISQPMLASSKEAVKKIQVFLLLEQLSSKRTILATIYLILTHLRHLVSFVEVRIHGYYFYPMKPLQWCNQKSFGMEFYQNHMFTFQHGRQSCHTHDTKDRRSRQDRTSQT